MCASASYIKILIVLSCTHNSLPGVSTCAVYSAHANMSTRKRIEYTKYDIVQLITVNESNITQTLFVFIFLFSKSIHAEQHSKFY